MRMSGDKIVILLEIDLDESQDDMDSSLWDNRRFALSYIEGIAENELTDEQRLEILQQANILHLADHLATMGARNAVTAYALQDELLGRPERTHAELLQAWLHTERISTEESQRNLSS